MGFSTVGSIASEFKPRSVFEKKIASLVNDNDIIEAHRKDGARLLELNKVSIFYKHSSDASLLVMLFMR